MGHSCDVVKHGNLLKITSIGLNLNVSISRDSAKSLRILLVKTVSEREAENTNLSRTQREKDTAFSIRRGGQRAWRDIKHVLYLNAVTDEDGHPLENEDES